MKATENVEMKRLMNARLWRCIDENGKAQDVAEKAGLNPQTLYNMRDNLRMPSTDTVLAIKNAIAKLDIETLYSNEETDNYQPIGNEQIVKRKSEANLTALIAPGAVNEMIKLQVENIYKDKLIVEKDKRISDLEKTVNFMRASVSNNRHLSLTDRLPAPSEAEHNEGFNWLSNLPQGVLLLPIEVDGMVMACSSFHSNAPMAQG